MAYKSDKITCKLFVGVDVSKGFLDVHIDLDGRSTRFANDSVGIEALMAWLNQAGAIQRVIFEATGPYHRLFERTLDMAGFAMVKLNPYRARKFAEVLGKLAKTDKIDAAMLARFGALMETEPRHVVSATLDELKELSNARDALVKDRTSAGNRLEVAIYPFVKQQLIQTIAYLSAQILALEAKQADVLKTDAELSAKAKILVSIPGIGLTSAHVLLTQMPELGTMDEGAIANLAGLAPHARESGTFKGPRSIRGGRGRARKGLFYPAMSAKRWNPFFKAKFDALTKAGKPFKVAMTALMRKLLILANALLRDGRKWTKEKPAKAG